MNEYTPTIGLEVHAELKTVTKMFCRSKNDVNEEAPNVNVCPVCMAHPGTLPVINREAVFHVLRVGAAIGAKLADYTEFDRKNYFYPDLPKGYQISQYEFPLVSGGSLNGVAITRIHLEEDTASSIHDEASNTTVIDYNRAGTPLMELVTEPVIHSAEEAGAFARELQLLLRSLGASDANMEKGEMRVEANVSVSNTEKWGTKVEIKNLNSFRIMERAVAYEIERQIKILENGGTVAQETRGWDEKKQETFSQRIKEASADYRYFPDPDLPSLKLSEIPEFGLERILLSMPELPWNKRERYLSMGIKREDADLYLRENTIGDFFEAVSKYMADSKKAILASNYIANDLVKIIRDQDIKGRDTETEAEIPISVHNFCKIIDLVSSSKISSRVAKDLLIEVSKTGSDPISIVEEKGLMIQADDLIGLVERVIDANGNVAADYKAGKASALEFLLGKCMKELHGAGDPNTLRALLKDKLA